MPIVSVGNSRLGGLGVFTTEELRAGELVRKFENGREITADAPLRPDHDERPEHCHQVDGRFFLVGSPDRYFNHSCDPNVYLRFSRDEIEVVARAHVASGTELTVDYLINNPGGDSWACRCGAARCRGETGISFFTLPEDLQREYLPLVAPWFRERYAKRLAHLEVEGGSQ